MSDPRSTYPQAKAWTFLLDTPDPSASSSVGISAAAAPGARKAPPTVGAGRPCLVAAGATAAGKHKNRPSPRGNCGGSDPAAGSVADGSGSSNGTEEQMGALCSKSTNVLENKENTRMGDVEDDEMMKFTNGEGSSSGGSGSVDANYCEGNGKGMGGSSADVGTPNGGGGGGKGDLADEGAMLAAMLESTALISPVESEETRVEGPATGGAVANGGIIGGLERGGAASNGYGNGYGAGVLPEERSAWVADNLRMLPIGAHAVEVDKLKQVLHTASRSAVLRTNRLSVFAHH